MSTLLSNCESWYNLTKAEIEELESVDEILLQKILETPCSTPKEMLFLELGIIPVRFVIIQRRLSFLHYILNEDKKSLIYSFLQEQILNPSRGDWINTVKDNLEALEIDLELDEIEEISKEQFKTIVDSAVEELAFQYLLKLKAKHSKVVHIEYKSLELQKYLAPNNLSTQQVKFIFQARSRMIDIRANFENKYKDLSCRACKKEVESQPHLLLCEELNDDNVIAAKIPKYEDLFSENLEDLKVVAHILEANFKKLT